MSDNNWTTTETTCNLHAKPHALNEFAQRGREREMDVLPRGFQDWLQRRDNVAVVLAVAITICGCTERAYIIRQVSFYVGEDVRAWNRETQNLQQTEMNIIWSLWRLSLAVNLNVGSAMEGWLYIVRFGFQSVESQSKLNSRKSFFPSIYTNATTKLLSNR